MSTTRWDSRRARLIGGPLHDGLVHIFPSNARPERSNPWLDYHRHPDGTYRWPVAQQEAS